MVFFFFEKARDTKETVNTSVSPPIWWCLKQIMASHLSSEKPFSLDYNQNIFLLFILPGQNHLAFLAAHCPVQAGGRDNVPTQVWSCSRMGRFLLGLPEFEKDPEKCSLAGEAGLPWVKWKHMAGWAWHRVHMKKHCYPAEGLGSQRGLLDHS